jgi:hypothetical protein
MTKGDELAIKYAENRAELRVVNIVLANIPLEAFEIIHGEAESWKSFAKDMSGEGHSEPWPGWIGLLDEGDCYKEDNSGDVYQIAKLWEERKRLGYELGKIRRSVAAHGRALIRLEKKND